MEVVIVLGLLLAALVVYIVHNSNKKKFTLDDKQFSQAAVTVDFIEKTIKIKNFEYSVYDVKTIRWASPGGGNSYAYIEVKDFQNPSHEIGFIGHQAAEQFMQRLTMAIEKAGGPVLKPL